MKKFSFLFLLAFSAFVIGCNSGSESDANNNNNNNTSAAPAETPASEVPPALENTGEGTTTTTTITTETAPPATPAPSGNVTLNPPHGEPGHRCDVAVGAPLPM